MFASSTSQTQETVANSLLQLCLERVGQKVNPELLSQQGLSRKKLAECIASIVARNQASGRVQRVLAARRNGCKPETTRQPGHRLSSTAQICSQPAPESLATYVDQVITIYLQEHDRIQRLDSGEAAVWAELLDQLAHRAGYMLRRQTPSPARARDLATDFAQEACQRIINHPFPYDVSFDAWATLILKNCIRAYYDRSPDVMHQESSLQSLDQPGPDRSRHNFLTDDTDDPSFAQLETQEYLLQAIAHLPSREQQEVVMDTFFYTLSDTEIARRLKKSKNAVALLRYRALRQLKQILKQSLGQ